ncbi:MAG: LamG domain-containing protein, partial [Planctomycetota bacterium]
MFDDGTVFDNDISINGNVTQTGPTGGVFGAAADFGGAASDSLSTTASAFSPGDGDFAVSFWINSPDPANNNDALIGKGDSGANDGYRVRLDSGNIEVRLLDNGDNNAGIATTGLIADNQFSHVVAQRLGDDLQLWIDNNLVATDTGNSSLNLDSGAPFLIGQRTNQFGTNPFEGLIDEVWVFDGSLTPANINGLFTSNDPL